MIPISGIMNHIAEMAYSETFFTKHISTRFAVLFGAFPLELSASLENAIKLPFQSGLAIINLACKTINICLDSQKIRNFTDKQPNFTDLLKTVLKIAGYAAGAFVTLTFGLLRPYDNFSLHVAFQLVTNEKALAEKRAAELKIATQKREQERAMQTHIENLVLLMRQKSLEREIELAAELKKSQEIPPLPEVSDEVEPLTTLKVENSDYKNFINDEISRKLLQEHQRIISAASV